MDNNLPKRLYRSIRKEDFDLYTTRPERIKYIKGKDFKRFEYLKDYVYQEDVRYLHFFDDISVAKGYAYDSTVEGKEKIDHVVCVFEFNDNEFFRDIKRNCKFIKGYCGFRPIYGYYDEYIMPLDLYKSRLKSVKLIERDNSRTPNVFGVVSDEELNGYISNISQVRGLDYLDLSSGSGYFNSFINEGSMASDYHNLPEGMRKYINDPQATRAIRLFGKESEAKKAKSCHYHSVNNACDWEILSAANAAYASNKFVVPFCVDPKILQMFKVEGTGREEYVVPLEYLSEANYYEVGCDWLEDRQEKSGNKPQMGE